MVVEVPDDAALVRATLPAAPRYQVLQDTDGQWYWLLVDADRKVLAVSGEYFLKSGERPTRGRGCPRHRSGRTSRRDRLATVNADSLRGT